MNKNSPGINKIGKTQTWYANFWIDAKFGMQAWNKKFLAETSLKLMWTLFVTTKFTENCWPKSAIF